MYAIGLDIGTTSVSAILLNTETRSPVRCLTLPNNAALPAAEPWVRLQDPNCLLQTLQTALDTLLALRLPVVSIGITGQMHGIVYLDKAGAPISPLVTWQDGRGDQPYRDSLTYAAWMQAQTGCPLATGYGAVTLFHDVVNAQLPAQATTFCTIHDLAAMTLTGRKQPLLHPSNAASLGLFDLHANTFRADAIAALGLDAALFPAVCSGFTTLGEYRGIPVSVAIGDNQASFFGSVAHRECTILVNMGTGGQVSCCVPAIPTLKSLDCRPLMDGDYILAGSSLCGGRAYAMLEQFFRQIAETVTGQTVESAYPAMNRLMAEYDETQPPLHVSTLFSGTRSEPRLRGSIQGIGLNNWNMATLCSGFLSGMVEELFTLYRQMVPCLPGPMTHLVGSGNGIRNNAALRRCFEHAFGLPMDIPAHKEEAAFGAALYALVAAGCCPDAASASALIRYTSET